MKRLFCLILTAVVLLILTSCGKAAEDNAPQSKPGGAPENEVVSDTEIPLSPASSETDKTDETEEFPKILIAYFSRTGNTKTIAENIQILTWGDMFEVKAAEPYPEDYKACLAQASEELAADYRPELSTRVDGMDDYDVVFVGYPVWHGDTPMAIRSFLEEYDLSGKTVIPFSTSGSSGNSQSVAAIRKLCPDSTVHDGICIKSSDTDGAYEKVEEWINVLGIKPKNQSNSTAKSGNGEERNGMTSIIITVGSSVFSAKLYDNDTAKALLALLPMTLNMDELNGNEKYHYLANKLPTASELIGSIKTGDLMLYGSDCMVLFYESFRASYSYTRIGYIENAEELADALGSESAEVTFTDNIN